MKQLKLKSIGDQQAQILQGEDLKMEIQSQSTQKQFQFQNAKAIITQKLLELVHFHQVKKSDKSQSETVDKNFQEIIRIVNQTYQFAIKINLIQESNFKEMIDFDWALRILQKCNELQYGSICVPEIYEDKFVKNLSKYFQNMLGTLQNEIYNVNGYNTIGNKGSFIIFLYKIITAQLKTKQKSVSTKFFNKLFSQVFVKSFTSELIFRQIDDSLLKQYFFILIKISQCMNYSLTNKKLTIRMHGVLLRSLEKTNKMASPVIHLLLEQYFKILQQAPHIVKINKSDGQLVLNKIITNYKSQKKLANIFQLQSSLIKLLDNSVTYSQLLVQQNFLIELLNYERFLSLSINPQFLETGKVDKIMSKIQDLFVLTSNLINLAQKSKLIQIIGQKIYQIFVLLQQKKLSSKSESERCILFHLLNMLSHLLGDFTINESTQQVMVKLFQTNIFQISFRVLQEEHSSNNFFFKELSQSVATSLKIISQMIYQIYTIKPKKNVFLKLLSMKYYNRFQDISSTSSESLLSTYLFSQNQISLTHKQITNQVIKKIRCTLRMPTMAQLDTTLE